MVRRHRRLAQRTATAALTVLVGLSLASCAGDSGSGGTTGASVERVPGVVVNRTTLAVSPDDSLVVVECGDELCVWDTADGALAEQWDEGRDVVVFNEDGSLLATGGHEGDSAQVLVVDATSGEVTLRIDAHDSTDEPNEAPRPGIRSLAFTPDGESLISLGDDLAVHEWSLATGEKVGDYSPGCDNPLRVAASADLVAISCSDAPTELFSHGDSDPMGSLDEPTNAELHFDDSGSLLVTGPLGNAEDPAIRVWRVSAGATPELVAVVPSAGLSDFAISPDGARLAISDPVEPKLTVWSIADDALVRELPTPVATPPTTQYGDPPRDLYAGAVAWSPDGRTLYQARSYEGVIAVAVKSGKVTPFEKPELPTGVHGG